jgi:hypothetical protein
MNFVQAVEAVIDNVKRPDKLAMARREVNAAILAYSSAMDHPRDLEEVQLALTLGTTHTVALSSLPRFRKMDWVRYPATRFYVKELSSRLLDCAVDIRDKWYVAGSSIKINLSREAGSLDISYYAHPPYLTEAAGSYWQLDANWPAIVASATSKLFIDIGDVESGRAKAAEAATHFITFSGDHNRGGS